ncbi:MAG: alpha-L-fucosidase [Fimbriimonas sp.]
MTPLLPLFALATLQIPAETPAQHDARMNWWREARFGMFVHWGLYAIPAGKWGSNTNHGEWIRDTAQIPVEEYDKLQAQFNPVKFEADAWARMAKDAGMKYLVLTSKHHDGFALFDSKYTDWDVMNTPFRRDIVRELAQACRRHGVKLGLYHSIMDWHHPDYLPRRPWERGTRPVAGADFDRFNKYLHNQVTEILTKYGDIAVVWFDGEWESTWNDRYGRSLYDLCRRLQPKTIINNRVTSNRSSMIDDGKMRIGDFATPEQYIPATGLPGVDWESCMTMNDHWGWNEANHNWKSSKDLIRNVVDTASKGGNYLLNIGPRPDGTFPPESVERLKDIGKWMRVNGDAIYGTQASPFQSLPWGRVTRKGNRLYLHVFEWPKGGVMLPGLASNVKSARLLGSNAKIDAARTGTSPEAMPDVFVTLPPVAPDPTVSVVELQFDEAPVVYHAPKIEAPSAEFVNDLAVKVTGARGMELRYALDTELTPSSPKVEGPIRIDSDQWLRVAGFVGGKRVTPIAETVFRKVTPWAATELVVPIPGLKMEEFAGSFSKVPDFRTLTARATSVADALMPAEAEGVARRYTGYIFAAQTDLYRFALTSDDGARLWIDDKLVVDNDGLHAAETKVGNAPLAKGWHRVEIGWFNGTGGRALDLKMAPAGTEPRPIVPSSLAHRP